MSLVNNASVSVESAAASEAVPLSDSPSLSDPAAAQVGTAESITELIDSARKELSPSSGHHHSPTWSKAFSEEHRALQRAGFESSLGGPATAARQSTVSLASGSQLAQPPGEQLQEHILTLVLSGSKRKKDAVSNDAELAEFIRQHPELSQYIEDLKQARDAALKNAQEGQTGLTSTANLEAKLDIIATLLEGAPLAPALRMADTAAKTGNPKTSSQVFEEDAAPQITPNEERDSVMVFAAHLGTLCIESSPRLPSEAMIDRFLALDPAEKEQVESYFQETFNKSADRYLLEAYMNIRAFRPETGGTALVREPVENLERVVSKLVLQRAAADGMPYRYREGEALDNDIFRKTIERIFETSLGTRPGQHPLCVQMGGIQYLDHFAQHARMYAVEMEIDRLSEDGAAMSVSERAALRAETLHNILPLALATNSDTNINLTQRLLSSFAEIPAVERQALAAEYQTRFGSSLEQSARLHAGEPFADAAITSISNLLAVDADAVLEKLQPQAVQDSVNRLASALQHPDPAELSASAQALHRTLCAQGISISRALDASLPEGEALENYLRTQIGNEGAARQAKAALFAVELQKQAGPNSITLPSQGTISCFVALPESERSLIDHYFRASAGVSVERYLIEAFSGIQAFESLNYTSPQGRPPRADAKQIVAALLVASAERRGEPLTLQRGQLLDANAPWLEASNLYSGQETSNARYQRVMHELLPQFIQREDLAAHCRQILLARSLHGLSAGGQGIDSLETDRANAAILAGGLDSLLTPDPTTGQNLSAAFIATLSNLPTERRLGLREEYRTITGRELLSDIRSGMRDSTQAQIDCVANAALQALGQDDYERRAGVIGESLARAGGLTAESFADLIVGLDVDGCFNLNSESIARFENTVAAYENISGESFAAMLTRSGVAPGLLEAIRTNDKAALDAFNVRATLKGSANQIEEIAILLGGEFNLNSHPEVAAAYRRIFGEEFGDVRETVTRSALQEYLAVNESMRRSVDTLRNATARELASLGDPNRGILTDCFFTLDGATSTAARDVDRSAEETLQLAEIHRERQLRLREATEWTENGSALLQEAAELQARGNLEQALVLDRRATELLLRANARMLNIALPADSLEARIETAQTLARQHAALVSAGTPGPEVELSRLAAREAFDQLILGPWDPRQTPLVQSAIRNVLEIDPSIDPRHDPEASMSVVLLLSNAEKTGYLDEIPETILALSESQLREVERMNLLSGLRDDQERSMIEQTRREFGIESEFHRNRLRPPGQRNLELLELEARYVRRNNAVEFQREWDQVMQNFDRTESQLKAVRTGVLVIGAIATGGATSGLAAGSSAGALTSVVTAFHGIPTLLVIAGASHGVQAVGDGALGNKSWGEARIAFINEGGRDMLNVALCGGMNQLMKIGKLQSFLRAANGEAAPAGSSLFTRSLVTGRQLAVSGAVGSGFSLGMEGSNIGFDAALYSIGLSDRTNQVSGREIANRLLTAGATGSVGGAIGGGSTILRQNISGKGWLSRLGRMGVDFGEFSAAGHISRYGLQVRDGGLSLHDHGLDGFAAALAAGSVAAGNHAARIQLHQGQSAPSAGVAAGNSPSPTGNPRIESPDGGSAPPSVSRIDSELQQQIASREQLIARLDQDLLAHLDRPHLRSIIEESLLQYRSELAELQAQARSPGTEADSGFEHPDRTQTFHASEFDQDGNFRGYDPSDSYAAELASRSEHNFNEPAGSWSIDIASPSGGGRNDRSGGGTALQSRPTRATTGPSFAESPQSNGSLMRPLPEAVSPAASSETNVPTGAVVNSPEIRRPIAPLEDPAHAPSAIESPEQLIVLHRLQNVAPAVGQMVVHSTRRASQTDIQDATELQPRPAVQPQPAQVRSQPKVSTATDTEEETKRRRRAAGTTLNDIALTETEVHKLEEANKKHHAEVRRSEKKGGAKLRFSKVVDELGDEALSVENEETGG